MSLETRFATLGAPSTYKDASIAEDDDDHYQPRRYTNEPQFVIGRTLICNLPLYDVR